MEGCANQRTGSVSLSALLLLLLSISTVSIASDPWSQGSFLMSASSSLSSSSSDDSPDSSADVEPRGLPGRPLRVHLLRISARYNFKILRNKWFPRSPETIQTDVLVPPTWSVAPKRARRRMKKARAGGGGGGGGGEEGGAVRKYELEVAAYPPSHIFHQHAAEYFLKLSLLTGLPDVTLVEDPSDAEIIFVPFFSSVSYHSSHRHSKVSKDLVKELTSSQDWVRTNGSNFVIPGVHPLALLRMWNILPSAHFLSVDFSCPPEQVAYLAKDIPVPYVSAVVPSRDNDDTVTQFHSRQNLLFFRGAVSRRKNGEFVRKGLSKAVKEEEGVIFEKGGLKWGLNSTGRSETIMRNSKFCLAPEGDTTSSCRLFDSILAGCIPVVVSDDIDPPFEELIDYTQFSIFVPTALAHRKGYLIELLRGIGEHEWAEMHHALLKVQRHFVFSVPARPDGAESMIWKSIGVRVRGGLRWKYRKKRIAQMTRRLTEAGLTLASWVSRPRGTV